MAGAGPRREPLGRLGPGRQGFGALATTGRAACSRRNPRRTRVGVSRPGSSRRSHGRRWSATSGRARRSWDVEAEVQRLEALGATRWDHQQERGYDFWVLRDPFGNEFCVLQPEFPELLTRRRPWPAVLPAADGSRSS
jgi:hypothetical protein